MASPTENLPQTALTRLFDRLIETGDAVSFSLPGGTPLFKSGEPAEDLYLLRTGRLGATSRVEGRETRFLGVVRPGEPAGEMALFAGAPHYADVTALRDSEILSLPRSAFAHAIETDPAVTVELARLIVARARQSVNDLTLGDPTVFGFVGVSAHLKVRPLVDQIARAVHALGYSASVSGVEAQSSPTEWFSNVEHLHDFVFYAAEADESAWKALVGRQVDRLFHIAAGNTEPPAHPDQRTGAALQAQGLTDLILVQQPDCVAPRGSSAWMAAYAPARIFQMRQSSSADIARMARVITGQAVGLVLSGGAARAYAHLGAIRVLRAHGTPIDFVCGVSTGAVIAAGVAMGWSDEELDRRIRKAFVESSPVGDVAFPPLIALARGGRVRARLTENFGNRRICDLWLPFFCLSSNLTTGNYNLHREGLTREALRASLALPGVLPPVIHNKDVLVDGAVMNNFPADVMRSLQAGPIVGVDVGVARSIEARDLRPVSMLRWILSGAWRRGPPIVSLLMRASTVTTGRDSTAAWAATDLLVLPKVEDIEIRDWKAYEPAVAAGAVAMIAALNRLTVPVTELRRRPTLAEQQTNRPAEAALLHPAP